MSIGSCKSSKMHCLGSADQRHVQGTINWCTGGGEGGDLSRGWLDDLCSCKMCTLPAIRGPVG